MMQHAADAFTVAAVLAGLWAAWLWRVASGVQIEPDRQALDRVRDPAFVALIHARAARDAWERAGGLNSSAAKWTAASVGLQIIATILGRLAMP
ncbi:hypothetical protein [Lichenibacterium dinghuense]|uniref:hypothetical protein n=1 Tax=Lichenibacterium dinghuense TaxID=2895977 RepID=UPI001F159C24|nr:hypothetical protein [Lichenibacterium sp. 6Y81]